MTALPAEAPGLLATLSREARALHGAALADAAAADELAATQRRLRAQIARLEDELARTEGAIAVREAGAPARDEAMLARLADALPPLLDDERARPLAAGRTALVGVGRDEDGVLSVRLVLPVAPPTRRCPRPADPDEAALVDRAHAALQGLTQALAVTGVRPSASEEFDCHAVELRLGRGFSTERVAERLADLLDRQRVAGPPLRLVWFPWWLHEAPESDELDLDDEAPTGPVAPASPAPGAPDPEDEATAVHVRPPVG